MSYVLAEINFAAFEQPRGAVVGLDGIGAALVGFLEAAGDTLSRLGRVSVGILGVSFLLLLGRVVFLLAAGILGNGGKSHEGCEGKQAEEFTGVFYFCNLLC